MVSGPRWTRLTLDYAGIIVGSLLTAAGLVVFLVPNQIAAGGISGTAVILHYLFGFPVGITILLLNIPLFAVSSWLLGLGFVIKTLVGVLVLSAGTDLLQGLAPVLTTEPLLAAIYGGGVMGLGLGLVLRSGATTGGTDVVARIINYFTGFNIGQSLFFVDAFVIAMAGFVFGAELALYALLSVFVAGRVIDSVQQGFSLAKAVLVVSEKPDVVRERVFSELDRGLTVLHGEGGYSQRDRRLLLVVVSRAELSQLKRLVHRVDPQAFVIISQVHEVLGKGFRRFG